MLNVKLGELLRALERSECVQPYLSVGHHLPPWKSLSGSHTQKFRHYRSAYLHVVLARHRSRCSPNPSASTEMKCGVGDQL